MEISGCIIIRIIDSKLDFLIWSALIFGVAVIINFIVTVYIIPIPVDVLHVEDILAKYEKDDFLFKLIASTYSLCTAPFHAWIAPVGQAATVVDINTYAIVSLVIWSIVSFFIGLVNRYPITGLKAGLTAVLLADFFSVILAYIFLFGLNYSVLHAIGFYMFIVATILYSFIAIIFAMIFGFIGGYINREFDWQNEDFEDL